MIHKLSKLTRGVLIAGLGLPLSTLTSATVLEEIMVTAQKREQGLQDVPISVQAVTGDTITKQGFQRLDDMAEFLPNVQVGDSLTGQQLYVRGVGTEPGNAGFEQSVATFIDGVYYGRGKQSLTQFLDISLVEVLRGPQPTFFGQNAIAGALNITTRRPSDEAEGYIRVAGGTEGEASIDFAYGGALSETFGARIAARLNVMDGWMEETYSGDDTPEREGEAIRLTANWTPSDELDVFLKAEHSNSDQNGFTLQTTNCATLDPMNPSTNLPCSNAVADGLDVEFESNDKLSAGGALDGPPTIFLGGAGMSIPVNPVVTDGFGALFDANERTFEGQNFQATINYDIGEYTLTSVTAFTEYEGDNNLDLDSTPYAILASIQSEEYEQASQELRIVSPTGEFIEWMAGVYWQNSDLDFTNLTSGAFIGGPFSGRNGITAVEDSTWQSAFAAVTLNMSEQWALDLGLRYTDVDKDGNIKGIASENTLNAPPGPKGSISLGGAILDRGNLLASDYEDDDWNPSINLRFVASEDVMVYAKYAEAFKAGGFNAGRSVPAPEDYIFESEHAESVELGAKLTLLDGRMKLNMALFQTEYEDQQVTAFDGSDFQVRNAGKSTSTGLEIDGRYAVSDAFTLGFAAAWLDATFDEYLGQCNSPDSAAGLCPGGVRDNAGETLLFAPEYNITFNGAYVVEISDSLELRLNADVMFSDDYNASNRYDPRGVQDSFEKINLRVALASADDTWELAVYGRNITDEQLLLTHGPTVLNGRFGQVEVTGRGESYGVQAVYKF